MRAVYISTCVYIYIYFFCIYIYRDTYIQVVRDRKKQKHVPKPRSGHDVAGLRCRGHEELRAQRRILDGFSQVLRWPHPG